MLQVRNDFKRGVALVTVIFLFVLGIEVTQAAKLTVKTVVKNTSGLLTLLHNKGGVPCKVDCGNGAKSRISAFMKIQFDQIIAELLLMADF